MNKLKIFENPEFGKVRVVEQSGEPWFVGKDVAEILGYKNPSEALQDHVDNEDKLNSKTLSSLGQRGGWLINESGLYALILGSKLESAKKFKRWVTSEVLPALRKTGTYSIPKDDKAEERKTRAEAMLLNAKTRAANLFLKMAEVDTLSPTYKSVLVAKAAATLSGEELLPLPKPNWKTYSAREIGDMFGVSANRIGKLANANSLKTDEYGEYQRSKSEYSSKEVDTWRYYDTVIPVITKLLGVNVA